MYCTTGRLEDIPPLDDDSLWESEHSESSCDTRGGCIACTFLRVLLDAFFYFILLLYIVSPSSALPTCGMPIPGFHFRETPGVM